MTDPNPLSDLWTSIVRTVTPSLVGWLVAFGADHGLDLTSGAASVLVAQVVAVVYYVAVRVMERARSTRWGWLLGAPRPPRY